MATISVGTVILAAGRSSRMGEPKLLLPWGQTSVLGHLLSQWQRLGVQQLTVVCAADAPAVSDELERLGFPAAHRIFNPSPDQGMFSSLRCAARWPGWEPVLTHWAVALGDQPHLSVATLAAVLEFSAAHPDKVCQPRYGGHRRHPVLLPKRAFERLASSAARDFREFLEGAQEASAYCELSDPGLMLDLDSPSDYEKALSLYGPR